MNADVDYISRKIEAKLNVMQTVGVDLSSYMRYGI